MGSSCKEDCIWRISKTLVKGSLPPTANSHGRLGFTCTAVSSMGCTDSSSGGIRGIEECLKIGRGS